MVNEAPTRPRALEPKPSAEELLKTLQDLLKLAGTYLSENKTNAFKLAGTTILLGIAIHLGSDDTASKEIEALFNAQNVGFDLIFPNIVSSVTMKGIESISRDLLNFEVPVEHYSGHGANATFVDAPITITMPGKSVLSAYFSAFSQAFTFVGTALGFKIAFVCIEVLPPTTEGAAGGTSEHRRRDTPSPDPPMEAFGPTVVETAAPIAGTSTAVVASGSGASTAVPTSNAGATGPVARPSFVRRTTR
ncbi:hypothetical protein JCM8097_004953 [Rhodosporidiobolus ruineniae]